MKNKKKLFVTLAILVVTIGSFVALSAIIKNPARIIARADQYYSEKSLDKARLEYMNVLRKDGKNPRAIRQLGLIWSEMGSPFQASAFLRHSVETDPNDLVVRRELAKVLVSLGQFASAREQALTILRQDPADGEALLMLASTSATLEQLAEVTPFMEAFDPASSLYYHLTGAILAGRRRDLPAALLSIEKAASINSLSAPVQLSLSSYYDTVNYPEKSMEALQKASDLSPGPSTARLLYAKALAGQGKSAEATLIVREITESSRYFLPAWGLLAELTLQAKDFKGAMTMVNEILTRDSSNPEGHLLRAGILMADNKKPEAVQELEQLNRMYPGSSSILLALAKSYLLMENSTRASSTLDDLLARVPNHPEATIIKARLDLAKGEAAPASASLEKLLPQQKGPALKQTELLLAQSYRAQGRLDEAAAIFEKQIAAAPDQAAPHFMLGMIQKEQGKILEAVASMEKAQKLAPGDLTITSQLIELDIAGKDYLSAHQRATTQQNLHSDDWVPYYLQGRVYSAEEKWGEAEKALLRAIEIKPDSLTAYNLLLDGYMKQKRIPEVIIRLESFLKEKPDSIPQWVTLAMLCAQQGDRDKEAAAYEHILTVNPAFLTALNNLAYLYAGPLDKPQRAMELGRQARTRYPESPEAADTLGWILFQQEKYPEALTLIEEAAGKLPDSPEVQYHLGMARYMIGQKETARTALEKAVSSTTDFIGIDKAREYLARLDGTEGTNSESNIESLTEHLRKTPGDLVARTALAGLQAKAGKFQEAAVSYQQALKGNPRLPDALVGLANLYSGPLADSAKAVEYARLARALDDKNPAAARALGTAVLQQGDFRYAYTLLKESSRNTLPDSGLTVQLARAAYGCGRSDEARALIKSVAEAPGDPKLAADAGQFLLLTGDRSALTASAVEAALKQNPSDAVALMASADLTATGGTEAAIPAYEKILKQFPDLVPAQAALASILSNSENLAQAIKLAEKARQALPDDPHLARTMGILSIRQGNAEPAVRFLKESNSKAPLDADGLVWLGLAQLKSGPSADGLATLQRALKANPGPALQKAATEAITKAQEEGAAAAAEEKAEPAKPEKP